MKLPQLSLRELLLLVALVAMGFGWWVDSSSVRREKDQAVARSKIDRDVMSAVSESAMPWIVASEALSEDAKAEFNKAYLAYLTASPDERKRMIESAKASIKRHQQ